MGPSTSQSLATPSGTDGLSISSSTRSPFVCQTHSAFSSDQMEVSGTSGQADHGHICRMAGSPMVGKSHPSPIRFTTVSSSSLSCDHDRCIGKWLGSCPGRLSFGSGPVDSISTVLAHQRSGTEGSGSGCLGVSFSASGSSGTDQDRQCNYLCLSEQDGRISVSLSLCSTLAYDDVDQTFSDFSPCGLFSRSGECSGRPFVWRSPVSTRLPTSTITSQVSGSEGMDAPSGSLPVSSQVAVQTLVFIPVDLSHTASDSPAPSPGSSISEGSVLSQPGFSGLDGLVDFWSRL